MSIVLMPYDEQCKIIAENIQRNNSQNIFITDGMGNIKETINQLNYIEFDHAIGIRQSIKDSTRPTFKIICSGKNPIPGLAEMIVSKLKLVPGFYMDKHPFYYLDNRYNKFLEEKRDKKSLVGSWFSEIKKGEDDNKPIFIIVIGEKNLSYVSEIEKAISDCLNDLFPVSLSLKEDKKEETIEINKEDLETIKEAMEILEEVIEKENEEEFSLNL